MITVTYHYYDADSHKDVQTITFNTEAEYQEFMNTPEIVIESVERSGKEAANSLNKLFGC